MIEKTSHDRQASELLTDEIPVNVLDMIVTRVKLRSRRRIAWLRKIWTESTDGKEDETSNLHAEVDALLDMRDDPLREEQWYASESSLTALNNEISFIEERLTNEKLSRVAQLRTVFGLTPKEMDVVHACLAHFVDPGLGRVYAYLHDHAGRTYVSRQLVWRLFGHKTLMSIGSASPLFAWMLVAETDVGKSEPAKIELDGFIRNWLLGSNDLDPALWGFARIQAPLDPLADWPVVPVAANIKKILTETERSAVRVFVAALNGSGRKTFAAAVCSTLGLSLLSIETHRITAEQWPMIYRLAQRQGWLGGCALLWEGNLVKESRWPVHTAPFRLQFVTGERNETLSINHLLIDLRVALPELSSNESLRLWKENLASIKWKAKDLESLVLQQPVSIGQLIDISRKRLTSAEEVANEIRITSRHQLGDLAQHVSSSFGWNDLVISEELRQDLTDFYFEAKERTTFWQDPTARRLFPQGKSLVALFTGPPGTGKTMAAQVIANSLGMDLFRIDLSSVVSKYVGETSRNLARILTRASKMNAVVFFDEADTLFGKKTEVKDAQDRHANADTNYLLTALDGIYEGIAILASNQMENMDTGFVRRLRYILNFQNPDAPARFLLWKKLLHELIGDPTRIPGDDALVQLSELVELTGAQIKLSILTALFTSRQLQTDVSIDLLVKGINREFAKEGRGLDPYSIEKLNRATA